MSPAPSRARRRGPRLGPLGTAFVTLAIVGAISFIAFNEGVPLRHGFRLHAIMSNANALRVKSPVRIAGVGVGKVTGLSKGPGATTSVDMEVQDSALPIHSDAGLRVKPRLFVEGGYYVALSPGSPSAPVLHDGGTIGLPQTRSAVQFTDVLSTLNRPVRRSLRNVLGTAAGSLSQGGAKGLRSLNSELTPVLRNGAIAAQALRGEHAHDLSDVIANGSKVTGALADHHTALAELVSNLATTTAALSAQDGALGDSVAQMDRVLRASPSTLRALDRALPPVRRFAALLEPNLAPAPRLIRALSGAVTQFGSIVEPRERDRVVRGLRAAVIDFPDTLTALTALLPVVKPVTDCVTTHVAPILNAPVQDGRLSTGQPTWQELGHLMVGFASVAQNFDANGYSIRYQAGLGPQTLGFGSVGSLGSLVGRSPSSEGVTGTAPVWVGRLGASAFNPSAPCADQPVPSLTATPGGSGARVVGRVAEHGPAPTGARRRALLEQVVRGLGEARP